MKRHSLIVLAVVGLVMFAGCASLISSRDNATSTPEATTEAATPAEDTTENGDDDGNGETTATTDDSDESEETTTPAETTPTTSESWSQPERPNTPLEDNVKETGENHIKEVGVGGEGSSEEGYSSVELTVRANTSWTNIDPEDKGNVQGEPYMLVYIDGRLATAEDSRFATPRGVIGARTPVLEFDENGEFTVTVPQEAFEASGVEPGEDVELMVLLLDRDKEWDDIFGKEFVTVTYEPDDE